MPGLLSEDDLTPQQREFARRYSILFTDEPQAVPRGDDGAEVKRARTMGRRPALLGGPSDPPEHGWCACATARWSRPGAPGRWSRWRRC
jgi:hypothetical protein